MKKVFLALAMLCTVAMMAGCKGGGTPAELDEAIATEAATDTAAVWQATDTDTSRCGGSVIRRLLILGFAIRNTQ